MWNQPCVCYINLTCIKKKVSGKMLNFHRMSQCFKSSFLKKKQKQKNGGGGRKKRKPNQNIKLNNLGPLATQISL